MEDSEEINQTSKCLRHIAATIKKANALPSDSDEYEYYSSFNSFRSLNQRLSCKLLRLITTIFGKEEFGIILKHSSDGDVDEVFDLLVEANDSLAEKIGGLLDSIKGVNKVDPVIAETVCATKTTGKVQSGLNYRYSKYLPKPQLQFTNPIDNYTPFVPFLIDKPNCVVSLSSALLNYYKHYKGDQTNTSSCKFTSDEWATLSSNPYLPELKRWTPKEAMLCSPCPISSLPNGDDGDTKYIYIDEVDSLLSMIEDLEQVKELAVDLEHHSYRTYSGLTCLIQISTRKTDYILDTFALRNHIVVLNTVFSNPDIVKVFHGANKDVMWLQRDFSVYVVGMFDTKIASEVLGLPQHSLAFLSKHYCNIDLDKRCQLADWRIRPLTDDMIDYAKRDTHYLLYIYDVMKSQLTETHGRVSVLKVFQQSVKICAKSYEKPVYTEESYKRLLQKSRRKLNNQQMMCYRLLYKWRDQLARKTDESCEYTLPNHMLFHISEVLPRESQGILACCAPVPVPVRQSLAVLTRLVNQARSVMLNNDHLVGQSASHRVQDSCIHTDQPCADLTHDWSNWMSARDTGRPVDRDFAVPWKVTPTIGFNEKRSASEVCEPFKSKYSRARLAKKIQAGLVSPLARYVPLKDDQINTKTAAPMPSTGSIISL